MKTFTAGWVVAGSLLAGMAIGAWLSGAAPFSRDLPGSLPEQARDTLAIVDPLDRWIRWSALLDRASPNALLVLRDALAQAPVDTGHPEVTSFAMWWAEFDPMAALAWTETEWRAQSRLVVASIFRVWAHHDPMRAYDQVSKLPKFHYEAALEATVVGWQESGKPGLVELVQSLPEGVVRQHLGETLARRIVLTQGAPAAMEWVEAIPDAAFRDEMARRVASASAERGDSAAIASWATPLVTSGTERPSGYPRRIGTRWILRDPKAALAWLESLPPGIDRDDGVLESYRDWARYSRAAAREWIQNAKLERWNEPAFSIYARSLAREKPEEALELVSRFSDDALRNRISAVIARKWIARDPAAAKAWLARSDVPEEMRRRAAQELRSAGATPNQR